MKNDTFETEITDMNNLGYGVSRHNGTVIFAAGGVTGDVLLIKIIKTAKSYSVARIERIIKKSPYRIISDCKISKACGGCTFRHISYEYELKLKHSYVYNAFIKAGISADISGILSPSREYGYRNKVQYPVTPDGDIGYYSKHSHNIAVCSECKLQNPAFDKILDIIKSHIKKHRISSIRHIYLRIGTGTGDIMVCLVSRSSDIPAIDELKSALISKCGDIRSICININKAETNVILGKELKVIYGNDYIEDILCGLRFRISALSFYQVNHDGAEALYNKAFELIEPYKPKKLADLYCGSGTIGIYFASRLSQASVYGIEIVEQAVANARQNAELNNISNAEFICADAAKADLNETDCVIVDPPRKGCSAELIQKIIDSNIETIAYISCNPDTLARDAAILCKSGYSMAAVTVVDMFPRTGAIECVTAFRRNV